MNNKTNHEILNKSAQYRGWIINGTVVVERLMDIYLSCHFADTEKKRDELMDLVFASSPGMPFDAKRNIFVLVLKAHNEQFHDSNKALFEDLSFIGKRRNIIAHYLLDRSESAFKRFNERGDIGFVKFKEKTETIFFSDADIKDLTDKIENAIAIIDTVIPKNL